MTVTQRDKQNANIVEKGIGLSDFTRATRIGSISLRSGGTYCKDAVEDIARALVTLINAAASDNADNAQNANAILQAIMVENHDLSWPKKIDPALGKANDVLLAGGKFPTVHTLKIARDMLETTSDGFRFNAAHIIEQLETDAREEMGIIIDAQFWPNSVLKRGGPA